MKSEKLFKIFKRNFLNSAFDIDCAGGHTRGSLFKKHISGCKIKLKKRKMLDALQNAQMKERRRAGKN